MKKVLFLVFIMVLCSFVSGFEYNITDLPFSASESLNVDNPGNDSMIFQCLRNQLPAIVNFTCIYTHISPLLIPPNSTNVTVNFSIEIPIGLSLVSINESYRTVVNGSLSNDSLADFLLNINTTVDLSVPPNITLVVSPANNSIYGVNDIPPTFVRVDWFGELNYTNSDLSLKKNGLSFNYSLEKNNSFFIFLLTNNSTLPEGVYTGNWSLRDDKNRSLNYSYKLTFSKTPPPKPLSVSPARGKYLKDTKDLIVTMPVGDYNVFFLVDDGYPLSADTGWVSLINANGQYRITLDFGSLPLGNVWLKITDSAGNYRIYSTGIISSSTLSISVDEPFQTGVQPGEQLTYDVNIFRKSGIGNYLRCKMPDFLDYAVVNNASQANSWSIKGRGYLVNDLGRLALTSAYGGALNIGSDSNSKVNLIIDVPGTFINVRTFESTLSCVVSEVG